jgi:flagellar hook-associated protein 2
MTNAINFGNYGAVGGRNIASGIASGIDTKTLVEELTNIKKMNLTKLEDSVKINNSKSSAYKELKTLLSTYKESLNALRNPPGFSRESENAFLARTPYLTTNDGTQGNTYMGVTPNVGADLSSYNIEISKIAKAKITTSQGFSDKTTNVTDAAGGSVSGSFYAGTFQINNVDITIIEGDSLIEIESSINAVTSQTNVKASIMQVSDTDYRLIIQSTELGLSNAFTITDTANCTSYVTFSNTQVAQDAEFKFNGIDMVRSSNNITDVIDDVTFSLFQPTPVGLILTAEIDKNIIPAQEAITKFIGSYNDLMLFYATNSERDDNNKYKETAILGGDLTLRRVMEQIIEQTSEFVSGLMDVNKPNSLGSIGINFIDVPPSGDSPYIRNALNIDPDIFLPAITNNFDDFRKVFEFDFSASSKTLGILSRSNDISVYSFSVDIDDTRDVGDQIRITYNDGTSDITINADYEPSTSGTGGLIIGKAGTAIEGLKLLYSGNGVSVINVNMTQGLADKLYNLADNYLSDDGGDISNALQAVDDTVTKLNDDINNQKFRIDEYRMQLLKRFSYVEEQISKANSILQLLDAQAKAMENR